LGALYDEQPVILKDDNGEGLTFRRTIAIDGPLSLHHQDDVSMSATRRSRCIRSPMLLCLRHHNPQVRLLILNEGH